MKLEPSSPLPFRAGPALQWRHLVITYEKFHRKASANSCHHIPVSLEVTSPGQWTARQDIYESWSQHGNEHVRGSTRETEDVRSRLSLHQDMHPSLTLGYI